MQPLISVLLGLGSNFYREANLRAAWHALAGFLAEPVRSPVVESAASGNAGEPYYNLVVHGWTRMALQELQQRLKQIENTSGRDPADTFHLHLDIDLLTYGQQIGAFETLVLPRPEMLSRAYILQPLAELVPDMYHPIIGKSYAQLWKESGLTTIDTVEFDWNDEPLLG